MRRIRIPSKTHGAHYALVDDEDFELVSGYRWCLKKIVSRTSGDVSFYAQTSIRKEDGSRTTIKMHRLILGLDFGDRIWTDHINFKTLDNRRCNLRACSPSESVRHRRKIGGTSSKYKGVCYNTRDKNWVSQIQIKGKQTRLGSFKTPKEAATRYDIAAHSLHGEFADLNFPKIDHSKDDFDIEKYKTPAKKRKSSKYAGVCWNKTARKWMSHIRIGEKTKNLGYFKNEQDAAKAYNKYVTEHGLNKKLNEMGM